MSTNKQIDANRANAAKSTGPKSANGKSASSKNATAHGLYSATVAVFYWESKADFDAMREGFFNRFRPIDCVEADLVNRLVDSTWRRNRILSIETTLIDLDIQQMSDAVDESFQEKEDGLLRVSLAFKTRHGDGVWDAIQRHLTATERSYQRAMRELRLLQAERFNLHPPVTVAPTAETDAADPAGQPEPEEIHSFSERTQFRQDPGAAYSPNFEILPTNPLTVGKETPNADLAA